MLLALVVALGPVLPAVGPPLGDPEVVRVFRQPLDKLPGFRRQHDRRKVNRGGLVGGGIAHGANSFLPVALLIGSIIMTLSAGRSTKAGLPARPAGPSPLVAFDGVARISPKGSCAGFQVIGLFFFSGRCGSRGPRQDDYFVRKFRIWSLKCRCSSSGGGLGMGGPSRITGMISGRAPSRLLWHRRAYCTSFMTHSDS